MRSGKGALSLLKALMPTVRKMAEGASNGLMVATTTERCRNQSSMDVEFVSWLKLKRPTKAISNAGSLKVRANSVPEMVLNIPDISVTA